MKSGFAPADTILSLEMRMKCGIGRCGRCKLSTGRELDVVALEIEEDG